MKLLERILKKLSFDYITYTNPKSVPSDFSYELEDMDKATEIFLKHAQDGGKIAILVDSDVDGYTSSSLLLSYIREIGTTADLVVHTNRTHGLSAMERSGRLDEFLDYDLVITPDSSSNDIRQVNYLNENGVDVIVLDHHPYKKDITVIHPDKFALVNNHGVSETVGVTVTYLFCKELDEQIWETHSESLRDLNSVGLIGDSAPASSEEVNVLVRDGLSSLENPFLKYILKSQDVKLSKVSPKDISFKINPLFNSTIRVGTDEEKKTLLQALTSEDIPNYYEYRGKSGSLYERAYKTCINRKKTQKTKVSKMDFEVIESPNRLVHILKVSGEETTDLFGLLAQTKMRELGSAVIVVNEDGFGSLRSPFELKSILNTLDSFNCAGHECACGVKITGEYDLSEVESAIEKYCSIEEEIFDESEYVKIKMKDINMPELWEVARMNKEIYGGIEDLVFIIEGVSWATEDVFNNPNILSISIRSGLSLVTFDSNIYEDTLSSKRFLVKPNVNVYKGEEKLQLLIEKILED